MDVKALWRSIDTLQRIYAFIAALAIGEAVRQAVLDSHARLELEPSRALLFVAFAFTLVPFVHGMNLHIDDHVRKATKGSFWRLTLFVDFFVFVAESVLLFFLAVSVGSITFTSPAVRNDQFAWALFALLLVDLVWSAMHSREHAWQKWAPVNLVALLGLFALLRSSLPPNKFFVVISLGAIVRTLFDYYCARSLYFPDTEPEISR